MTFEGPESLIIFCSHETAVSVFIFSFCLSAPFLSCRKGAPKHQGFQTTAGKKGPPFPSLKNAITQCSDIHVRLVGVLSFVGLSTHLGWSKKRAMGLSLARNTSPCRSGNFGRILSQCFRITLIQDSRALLTTRRCVSHG